jgi:hypothetical protein
VEAEHVVDEFLVPAGDVDGTDDEPAGADPDGFAVGEFAVVRVYRARMHRFFVVRFLFIPRRLILRIFTLSWVFLSSQTFF